MVESKEKVKTAYIYARTSSDDGDYNRGKAREAGLRTKDIKKKESIDEQIRLCEAKCHSLGLTVIGRFVDSGYSGRMYPTGYEAADDADCEEYFLDHINRKNKKTRPDFGKFLDADRADYLVVRDLSRVVRPYRDSFVAKKIWQLLRKKKIKLITTEEGEIDQDKFHDRLVRDLRMQIEDEAKQKEIERCRQSLAAKKNNGSLASGVKCLGFVTKKREKDTDPQAVTALQDELKTVRIIFDKCLGGMKLLAIARLLNDKLKILTKEGHHWTVNQVRKVLLRPCYSGQQYNMAGELIESKVFPAGDKAIVTPDEFGRVLMMFKQRARTTVKSDPEAPGPAIGTQPEGGVCHPFSGLVRCGNCGKHMYISLVTNRYYSEKIPVHCFHYICKTPEPTDDPQYTPCRQSRIKEHYPEKSLELGIKPNGNGLIEALFPLLFGGYIPQYIDRIHATPALAAKRQQLKYEIDQIAEQQDLLFSQQERKIIDEDQYAAGMKRQRERRVALTKQLTNVEETIRGLETNAASIPDQIFLDPNELSRETMRDLAHDIFESILVYSDRITVTLKRKNPTTGQQYAFDIGRIRTSNSRDLPFWKARINSQAITPETKIGVTYFYPSTRKGLYRNINVLYHDRHLEVIGIGDNISIDKKRNEALPLQTSFDRYLIKDFGEPPAYGRLLEMDSKVFYGPLIVNYPNLSDFKAEMADAGEDNVE